MLSSLPDGKDLTFFLERTSEHVQSHILGVQPGE